MADKYYAVKQGRKTGIFDSWDDAKPQVDGYTNAIYKSFKNKKEAEEYLGITNKTVKNNDAGDWTIAYTDGSYLKSDDTYSYGAVIYLPNETLMMSQRYHDENSPLRNVAGEIYGAAKVMEYAYNNKISKLEIHHDYRGVGAWPTKEWQANKDLTKKYADFYNKISKKVQVRFVWVKGHAGFEGNELVDQLAKYATFDYKEVRKENHEEI